MLFLQSKNRIVLVLCLFNSRTAIEGAMIGLLLVFYNTKNLNCTGALSFLRSVYIFSYFLKSNGSSDFGQAETGNEAKKRVVLRREIFSL